MKKIFATLLLLMCVSVAFAGTTGDADNVINNPKQVVCHDADGKWNPSDKSCDPGACGCLFHEIEEFIKSIFA